MERPASKRHGILLGWARALARYQVIADVPWRSRLEVVAARRCAAVQRVQWVPPTQLVQLLLVLSTCCLGANVAFAQPAPRARPAPPSRYANVMASWLDQGPPNPPAPPTALPQITAPPQMAARPNPEPLPPPDQIELVPPIDSDPSPRMTMPFPSAMTPGWPRHAPPEKPRWIQPYARRAATRQDIELGGQTGLRATIPPGFVAWWHNQVVNPMQRAAQPRAVNVETLTYWALKYSPHIQALSESPLIRETAIVEAAADFDWTAFMDSKYDHISEPVGNELTTGGPSRFRDRDWTYRAGVRRKTFTGGEFSIDQRIGFQHTNSLFFIPPEQGTSQLSLRFSQPLLNGRGPAVNTSLIVQAEIETGIAWDQFAEGLQDHLLNVTETYWRLYLGRASLLQRQRHLRRAAEILQQLENRRDIDALQSQIVLAGAAVASRQAELVRAATNAKNAETRLRALVNAPELTDSGALELVPVQAPGRQLVQVDLCDALLTALQHRQEIDAAVARIQTASVRLNVSRNELLPALDLVMETYVQGLAGEANIGQSLGNQFSIGEPSYSLGLRFEVPLGNRAAIARCKRRRLEIRQLVEQFKSTVANLEAEVEVAVREVKSTYREMEGHYESMQARLAETDYLKDRWELLPGDDRASSFLLEELLEAQDRLAIEEFAFVRAELGYMVSLTRLNRVMGTLLEQEQVSVRRICQQDIPQLILDKPRPAEPLIMSEQQ